MRTPDDREVRLSPWFCGMVAKAIADRRPKGCTGFYITSEGIRYGRRTNKKKAPDNYVFFYFWDEFLSEEEKELDRRLRRKLRDQVRDSIGESHEDA